HLRLQRLRHAPAHEPWGARLRASCVVLVATSLRRPRRLLRRAGRAYVSRRVFMDAVLHSRIAPGLLHHARALLLSYWARRPKPSRFYIAYASLAVALLAKGLIAPVFFGAAVIPYLLITGEWRRWREMRLFTGILLFLAIGAPWHILCGLRNPDQGHPVGNIPHPGNVHGYFYFYFINEHFLRFLGKRYPHDYNKQ